MNEDKEKMLKLTTDQIESKFGKGSIMTLGEGGADLNIGVIPTGALPLDAALGIGGVPRGRIIEIYGPESSGKTTLALQILAEAQALGGIVAFIDAEHALDPVYAARIGVDIDEVLISQPDTGEQALEICDMLVRSGAIDCVIVDSVAALVPRAEIEGEMGDTTVGLQARLMSQALRKLAGSLSKSNTTCIFINQLREKIGVMFGNPETTTGGRALKFFSSVRIDIRRIDSIKQNGDVVGNRVRGGIPGYRARIRPIVSRITIHWPSFYNVVTGKTLALPNLIALQHIPLSPAGVIAKRPAPIALPNSCAAEWRMAPDAVFSPYASVRYFTPHMVHSQYNLL